MLTWQELTWDNQQGHETPHNVKHPPIVVRGMAASRQHKQCTLLGRL
jgi:hypothetical protein